MATFLDIGLIGNFGVIFIILLIFVIVFGLLEYIKPFGSERKGLHGIIALAIALIFLASRIATTMVAMMVPWFIVLGIFIFFSLLLVRMFGLGEGDMKKLIADANVYPWIIIFVALILLISLGNAFGQTMLEKGSPELAANQTNNIEGYPEDGLVSPEQATTSTSTPSFTTNLLNTLRHPKVLGLIFVLLIAALSMIFLTKPVK